MFLRGVVMVLISMILPHAQGALNPGTYRTERGSAGSYLLLVTTRYYSLHHGAGGYSERGSAAVQAGTMFWPNGQPCQRAFTVEIEFFAISPSQFVANIRLTWAAQLSSQVPLVQARRLSVSISFVPRRCRASPVST